MALQIGDYALFGKNKVKCIYLGETPNGNYMAVAQNCEDDFQNGRDFMVLLFNSVEEIVEPEYYYKYERLTDDDFIVTSSYVTVKVAEQCEYTEENGWYKIESSKRTWGH